MDPLAKAENNLLDSCMNYLRSQDKEIDRENQLIDRIRGLIFICDGKYLKLPYMESFLSCGLQAIEKYDKENSNLTIQIIMLNNDVNSVFNNFPKEVLYHILKISQRISDIRKNSFNYNYFCEEGCGVLSHFEKIALGSWRL